MKNEEKSGSSAFFYVICLVAVIVTSIISGYFVSRARVYVPGNASIMQKIERHEMAVAREKNR